MSEPRKSVDEKKSKLSGFKVGEMYFENKIALPTGPVSRRFQKDKYKKYMSRFN